jgi:hypothetical protein
MLSCAFLAGAIVPVLMGLDEGGVGLIAAVASLGAVYGASGVIILIAMRTSFAKGK